MPVHFAGVLLGSLDFLLTAVVVDRCRGRVTLVRHLRLRKTRALSEFDHLAIHHHHGSAVDDEGFCLSLCGAGGLWNLLAFRNYLDIRRAAETIASFVGFDIQDEVFGPRTFYRRPVEDILPESGAYNDPLMQTSFENDKAIADRLFHEPDSTADRLQIDHDENPRRSALIAICLFLIAGMMAVFAFSFRAQSPFLTIGAAGAFASAVLLVLNRRKGLIFVRGANSCFQWRIFKNSRFVQQISLDHYSEVTIHPEMRFYDDDDSNPYRESDGPNLYYVICLDGESVPLEIRVASDQTAARKLAARVANFVDFELCDFTKAS